MDEAVAMSAFAVWAANTPATHHPELRSHHDELFRTRITCDELHVESTSAHLCFSAARSLLLLGIVICMRVQTKKSGKE